MADNEIKNTSKNAGDNETPGDSGFVIDVKDVTKIYRLYDKPIDRLKEAVSLTHKNYHRDFYALNHINFKVGKGESVGIIGTNGSGKSTILKIITGVLTPSDGEVNIKGIICALLELGAGFNPDYTGIENVYMNGTMMGFTKEQMDEKLQEILDFADIGDFVNQPVKSYSSGMFVRLAFAMYVAMDPEILIVDEALSVGDVFFQAKCYHRMDELRRNGTTILMVTHDLGSVMKYCDRVVLINKGEKIAEGKPGEMVDLYKKILAGRFTEEDKKNIEKKRDADAAVSFIDGQDFGVDSIGAAAMKDREGSSGPENDNGPEYDNPDSGHLMQDELNLNPNLQHYGDGRASIYDLGILDQRGKVTNVIVKGETFSIKEKIRFNAPLEAPIFTFTIKDKRGADLTGTNTMIEECGIEPVKEGDEYVCTFTQRMTLQGGEYLLSMSCTGFEQGEHVVYDRKYDVASITVLSNKNTVGVYDMESKVTLERHNRQ
ncbi:teichoic acid transport system ATP-binding protein [Oribacterium sp. KHPX15]|uniref:ABC transporter ATP-binding protein n=1 Tax=unclassified Oribacterium TaxID=2629782 RepID=UPI0008978284|nr:MULTISPECIES: ABC transporter ATP-binding protein [unclassified Oribacterium]SEA13545.1 teichoic acid transport system ATP-binding protein [Oribacterium sp. KHPX15]